MLQTFAVVDLSLCVLLFTYCRVIFLVVVVVDVVVVVIVVVDCACILCG